MIPTPLQHESLVASVTAKSASILSSMRAQFGFSRRLQAANAVPDRQREEEGDSLYDDVVPDSDAESSFTETGMLIPKAAVPIELYPAIEVPDETRALSDVDVFLTSDALESVSQPFPRIERTLLNCAFLYWTRL